MNTVKITDNFNKPLFVDKVLLNITDIPDDIEKTVTSKLKEFKKSKLIIYLPETQVTIKVLLACVKVCLLYKIDMEFYKYDNESKTYVNADNDLM